MKKIFICSAIFISGLIVGFFLLQYSNLDKAYAAYPESNVEMKWEYLRKGSDSLGMGELYRCKVSGGWLIVHTNRNSVSGPNFIPDPTYSWK
jgi:hypothetical protein